MTRLAFPRLARAASCLALAALLAACGGDDDDSESDRADDPQPAATAQMQAVLDKLAALGAKPLDTLTIEEARTQPTPADAVRGVLEDEGRSTAPEAVASVEDRTIPGPAGDIAVRVYTPAGSGPRPVVLYIHGGGWVIATIDTYDASARALANAADAVVVSTDYRHAPEDPFPAAHDDTYAAYLWTLDNAVALGGEASRVAVVGESAGGNMAASIAQRARDDGETLPVHQVLVYPVIDAALDAPSEEQNRDAQPLNTGALAWFYEKYLTGDAADDPRFAVGRDDDLSGLPSATVITADIDPLRSEGRAYAEALEDAGVSVEYENFEGVTHEFFGMGAVVDEAREAVAFAAASLKAAFAR